ncbi:four helix bundle protein [bacterium]|nr:four helix bundle protein [bacterium]
MIVVVGTGLVPVRDLIVWQKAHQYKKEVSE